MTKNVYKFINIEEIVDFTRRMICTPSVSGEEKEIANLVVDEMRQLGYDEVFVDKKYNAVGIIKGSGSGPKLMLNGHLDHAEVGKMKDPYSARIMDGESFGVSGKVIYGRGACDMKGGIAAMIYAAAAVKKAHLKPKGDIIVAANSLEEVSQAEGINYIFEEDGINADMVINGEATNLNVHLGHRGMMEVKVTVNGRSCHASNPVRGINAIYKAGDFMKLLQDKYHLPEDNFFGNCTVTPIDINASPGRLSPIVPDQCVIFFDRRFLPSESPEKIENEFQQLIKIAQREIIDFNATIEITKIFPELFCSQEEPVVQALLKARERVLGEKAKLSTWIFGIDGAFIAKRGIPCAGFGPGNELFAHTPEDHIPIEHLEKATKVYAEAIIEICVK